MLTEKFGEENIVGLDKGGSDVPGDDMEATDSSNDRINAQDGIGDDKYVPTVFMTNLNIQNKFLRMEEESEEEYSGEEFYLSSDDSDIEVINAPLCPAWLRPHDLIEKIGLHVWHQSVFVGEGDTKKSSTSEIYVGSNSETNGDVEKLVSPRVKSAIILEEHQNFMSSQFALGGGTFYLYREVFQGITCYIFDYIRAGLRTIGNIVLDRVENTLQEFVAGLNDRTEAP